MGRKGRKNKGSASNKVKTIEIETTLLSMKKCRGDAAKQAKLCETLMKFAQTSPEVLLTFSSEASLCLLLALKTDPDDANLQASGVQALCVLLLTPGCTNSIFRLGGVQALMNFMEKNNDDVVFLRTILQTMGCICSCSSGGSNFYGPKLVAAGFVWHVFSALKTHPGDIRIHFHGTQILTGVLCSCFHDEELLKEAIDVAVSTIDRFGGSHSGHHSVGGDEVLLQSCNLFIELMDAHPNAHPNTVSIIQNAGAPAAVLSMMKNHAENAKVQSMSSWLLRRFAKNDDDLCSECLLAVVSALKLHCNDEVRAAGTAFIEGMVASKHGALLLFSSGYVPFVFDMMKSLPGQEHFQSLGCTVMAHLAKWDETREAVLTEEAVSLLAAATKACEKACNFEESEWGCHCVEAMFNFFNYFAKSGESPLPLPIFTDRGAVKASIKVVKEVVKAGQVGGYESCAFFFCLACCGNEIKLEMAREGGIGVILAYMKLYPGAYYLQCNGCKTLGRLTTYKHPVILESIARADGVNVLMDAIEQFPDDKDIFNYGGSAALLAREFELGRIHPF